MKMILAFLIALMMMALTACESLSREDARQHAAAAACLGFPEEEMRRDCLKEYVAGAASEEDEDAALAVALLRCLDLKTSDERRICISQAIVDWGNQAEPEGGDTADGGSP